MSNLRKGCVALSNLRVNGPHSGMWNLGVYPTHSGEQTGQWIGVVGNESCILFMSDWDLSRTNPGRYS